ncbi:MAG TPA: aminotransferase class III-fold pyridoxal phosphate-dependent enzyme [Gemmatimonadaceae bacterium]|nr:aminotransferase class III-fold pyridoxal phosphate-dependent enzyme [Gemmatimonadaceae bacterium]
MVFSRFFKQREPAAAEPAPSDVAGDEDVPDELAEAAAAATAADEPDADWASRAARLLPSGASTGSKRQEGLYGDAECGPTHFQRAAGCRLVTAEGETLVDCTMALGAVAIGYAEPELTRAVIEAAAAGHVAGLSHTLEVELAERFCNVVPCAERVQFLKTGAEAVAATVRLARAYTGRDVVIGCGYFGWHDWCSSARGVPAAVSRDYRPVAFDDIAALERAVAAAGTGSQLAAIVLEPVIERLPSEQWISRARELCDEHGAVLVFDEIKTGFRLATGGYQQYSGITPDLAAFGKAMANGFPLSAVCGRADLMDCARETWISSTLAGEATALAAAAAVLDWHRSVDVCEKLASIGKDMRDVVATALTASGVAGVTIEGIDPMWFLRFDSPGLESRFLAAAARHGALFKRGPYNFASLAHDDDAMRIIEAAASNAFVEIQDEPAAEA